MVTPLRLLIISMAAIVLFVLNGIATVRADVKMPSIFGDHMVLQQEAKLPVWGTADPGEQVTVTAGDRSGKTTTDRDGRWRIDLEPFPYGTPATTMTVEGKNTLKFSDVLIGDVWVCSGQSNMEATLEYAYNGREASQKAKDPELRLFLVARTAALHPQFDVSSPFAWKTWDGTKRLQSEGDHPGTWIVCESHSASKFSAVAYFFGRALRDHLKRPIGLIATSWGGTTAEAWTSLDSLEKVPPFTTYVEAHRQNLDQFAKHHLDYEQALAAYRAEFLDYEARSQAALSKYQKALGAWQQAAKIAKEKGLPEPALPKSDAPPPPKAPERVDGGGFGPSNLFNAMIAPLIPYGIKGVLWYQGESNTRSKALEYRLLLPRLIADWREQWGQGDFPFLIVQISHFPYAVDGTSALIREAQVQALALPNTGLAVTVDIPCDDPGHPRDKQTPGERLALAARHVAYGEQLVYSGPLYKSINVEGRIIRIQFSHVGGGLMIGSTPYQPPTMGKKPIEPLPTDRLVGFTIAGADKKFVSAEAVIDGDTVVVSSPTVAEPAAVRFAWGDKVECNLYNREKLPASPFRTDDWNDFKYQMLAPKMIEPTFGPETFSKAARQ